jgi:hypothetical protein
LTANPIKTFMISLPAAGTPAPGPVIVGNPPTPTDRLD